MTGVTPPAAAPAWRNIVAPYEEPDTARAITQLLTTLGPLAIALAVTYRSLALPYWVTLLLCVPTAGFLIRTFIIMHDCAHRSFLKWPRLNDTIGVITGILTATPFGRWRRDHARHHASSGDLDRRGHGDVPTLTVREYASLSRWARFKYRILRHPALLIGFGPLHLLVLQRFPPKGATLRTAEGMSVHMTNAGMLLVFLAFAAWVGPKAVLLVYVPAMYMAGIAGIWLFYVQHQFENAYWRDHAEWDYVTSAIRGSSYFKLPAPFRWITGNIGLHHVHHLSPRIPNYRLKRCHDENPLFHEVTVLTFLQSVRTFKLSLWDEDRRQLVSFDGAAHATSAGSSETRAAQSAR
jgi:omega-6 fatty acid desaturase (delta-12 desaturase)